MKGVANEKDHSAHFAPVAGHRLRCHADACARLGGNPGSSYGSGCRDADSRCANLGASSDIHSHECTDHWARDASAHTICVADCHARTSGYGDGVSTANWAKLRTVCSGGHPQR